MHWPALVAYLFGGVFAANAVPHFVAGVLGRSFQTPFAQPSGKGLSSSTVNVLWGFFCAVLSYVLVLHVGAFSVRNWSDAGSFAVGVLAISVFTARHFGEFHGGNAPVRP